YKVEIIPMIWLTKVHENKFAAIEAKNDPPIRCGTLRCGTPRCATLSKSVFNALIINGFNRTKMTKIGRFPVMRNCRLLFD
ncbi:MAG: hypothetical protein ABIQ11_09470, partial [Saprospiraceae bacterium]